MADTGLENPGILQAWLKVLDFSFRFVPDFEQNP